jgi:hypothetical protein
MVNLNFLRTIAEVEFSDIVTFTFIIDDKLRVLIIDIYNKFLSVGFFHLVEKIFFSIFF